MSCGHVDGGIVTLLDVTIPGERGFQRMAFTQTLQLRKLSTFDQYDSTANIFARLVKTTFGLCTIVAELTESADVHYHGIIRTDKSQMATSVKWKAMIAGLPGFGYFKLKLIDDEPGWVTYLSKSLDEVKKVLHDSTLVIDRAPIVMDGLDLFKDKSPNYHMRLGPSDTTKSVRDCFIRQSRAKQQAQRAAKKACKRIF